MNFIAIIPARYASTRLPGKPLIDILGKPMIQRVYEQVSKAVETVIVATDDNRIAKKVANFGGNVVMTSKNHKSGTDRIAEAIIKYEIKTGKKFDVIINVQGDEPYISPEQIKLLFGCFKSEDTQIATLIKKISNKEDIFDTNTPKVVFNKNKEALYFSRSPIPFVRDLNKKSITERISFYKHIGIYAYRKDILKEITNLEVSNLEKAESLEQNRWLENNYKIRIEFTEHESISVDTKEDLKKINFKYGNKI